MSIFDFDSYLDFLTAKLKSLPKRGHGQATAIALHLEVHTSLVSQIFGGHKVPTEEQACALGEYFGFSELESDYFLELVRLARSGSTGLRKKTERRLEGLKKQSTKLKNRVHSEGALSDADTAIFYSQWYFSGTRLATALPKVDNREALSKKMGLPIAVVDSTLQFLLSNGLCVNNNGKIQYGPRSTHVGADSPFVNMHHTNWRMKGMGEIASARDENLFFTSPMILSDADYRFLRSEIVSTVERLTKVADASPSETFCCLNVDFFKVV